MLISDTHQFNEQGFWNDAERQIYTEIMARDTLVVKISDSLSRALEMTDYVKKTMRNL